MVCPLCRKDMERLVISGVTLDECDKCHGIWFDRGELQSFDEKHEGSGAELERILSYSRFADLNPWRKVTCPKCRVQLERHEYIGKSKIFIDECFNCGGIWLDRGELGVIRENFKGYDQVEDPVEAMLGKDPVFQKYMSTQGSQRANLTNLSRMFK